jgi:hypothetical protein
MSKRAFVCAWGVCLQEPVLHLQYACSSTSAFCRTWTCLSSRACAAPVRVCLQELCTAPERVCLQECCTCACLSRRDLCCTWTCLPTRACAATMHVCLQEHSPFCACRCTLVYTFLFGLFSVCFETDMFVSVVSIYVQNTETNRNKPKKVFFGFVKQTEKQPKQI